MHSNRFETEDGIKANQQGEMKKIDEENSAESVTGGYSYTDDDGNIFSLTYVADQNGFRPVSNIQFYLYLKHSNENLIESFLFEIETQVADYLPTSPPIPIEIARALEWAATAKPWIDPWVVEQELLRESQKGKEPAKRSVRRV